MICVVRVTTDEIWLLAWWFSASKTRGRIVLERFVEYVASRVDDNGFHQYILMHEQSRANGTIDVSTIPMIADAIQEATAKALKERISDV